jgi:DNA repair protein RadC
MDQTLTVPGQTLLERPKKRRFSTIMSRRIETSDSSSEVAIFCRGATEKLLVIHLSSDRHVIEVQMEQSSMADQVSFPVRQIVAAALALNTHSLLIAHNHPSGIAQPSKGDMCQTRILEKALHPLNIGFEDHLILAEKDQFSFRAAGLL